MRKNKCHYQNASLQRLYLSRDEGGRGLQSVMMTWEREIVYCVTYLLAWSDPKVQDAMMLQKKLKDMGKYDLLEKASEVLQK